MLAGVGDRLLRDAQQLGLDLGAQPGRGLVQGEVHGEPGAGADRPDVVRQRRAEAGGGRDLAAQVEDRQPQLADHAADLRAQRLQPWPAGRRSSAVAARSSTSVAERGDLLGDAVVDLAGQPLPLLHASRGSAPRRRPARCRAAGPARRAPASARSSALGRGPRARPR